MKMPQSIDSSPAGPAYAGGPGRAPLDPEADLDECIRHAELAVIARDEHLRHSVRELGQHLRERTGRSIAVGAGVVAGTVLLFRFLPRMGRKMARSQGNAGALASLGGLLGIAGLSASAFGSGAGRSDGTRPPSGTPGKAAAASPLVHALTLLLPMLPARLRARFPRASFDLLLGVGLPLLSQLSAIIALKKSQPTDGQAPVTPVADLDLDRYLGQWFEIARLPLVSEKQCRSDISAHYSLDPEAGQLNIVNRCRRADGSEQSVAGVATLAEDSLPSQLRVTFAPRAIRMLPLVWADYWVLHVDADYRYALVGTPDRKHLWLLSRTPRLTGRARDVLLDEARTQGYDLSRLIETEHGNPPAH